MLFRSVLRHGNIRTEVLRLMDTVVSQEQQRCCTLEAVWRPLREPEDKPRSKQLPSIKKTRAHIVRSSAFVRRSALPEDRKRVGEGKSVDLGGRRIIKKKKRVSISVGAGSLKKKNTTPALANSASPTVCLMHAMRPYRVIIVLYASTSRSSLLHNMPI